MSRDDVAVLVYGDIGRSPRMQNHSKELAQHFNVHLLGERESYPFADVSSNSHIKIVDLSIHFLKKLKVIRLFYLYALIRILLQTLHLLYILVWKLPKIKFIIVQNPPSIPVLSTVWLASKLRGFKIMIDFHNYGFTILKMGVKNKIVCLLAYKYEKWFGKRCHQAFCVSDNMKENLEKEWGINAITLYDRPSGRFNIKVNRYEMFNKINVVWDKNKDLVVVSSTSWTKDEDFGILLKALQQYYKYWNEGMPYLHVLITGKGPEKAYYQQIIDRGVTSGYWTHFTIKTLWLEPDDYPRLLASCDLGVCLHYSSSGLDLPMKVVDMFGAGLPVLAIDFQTIRELVKNDKNGFIFKNTYELTQLLLRIGKDKDKYLKRLRYAVKLEQSHTWKQYWQYKLGPLLNPYLRD